MNPFTERYRNLKSGELIEIVNNPEGFQELAVEAARAELANRNLSNEGMAEAIAEAEAERKAKQWREDRKKALADKVANAGSSVLTTFSPVHGEGFTVGKQIASLSLFFAILSIYNLYRGWTYIQFLFSGDRWEFGSVYDIFRLCFVPVAAYLFWKHHKIGWILVAALLTRLFVVSAVAFFNTLFDQQDGVGIVEAIFPTPSPLYSIAMLAIWSGCIWVVCQPALRAVFNVDRKLMFITLGIVSVLSIINFYFVIGI